MQIFNGFLEKTEGNNLHKLDNPETLIALKHGLMLPIIQGEREAIKAIEAFGSDPELLEGIRSIAMTINARIDNKLAHMPKSIPDRTLLWAGTKEEFGFVNYGKSVLTVRIIFTNLSGGKQDGNGLHGYEFPSMTFELIRNLSCFSLKGQEEQIKIESNQDWVTIGNCTENNHGFSFPEGFPEQIFSIHRIGNHFRIKSHVGNLLVKVKKKEEKKSDQSNIETITTTRFITPVSEPRVATVDNVSVAMPELQPELVSLPAIITKYVQRSEDGHLEINLPSLKGQVADLNTLREFAFKEGMQVWDARNMGKSAYIPMY